GLDRRRMALVHERDGDRSQRRLVAVADLVDPPPEVERSDDPAAEGDVGHPREPGQLADLVRLLVSVSVFGNAKLDHDRAALAEAGGGTLRLAGSEVDEEVE